MKGASLCWWRWSSEVFWIWNIFNVPALIYQTPAFSVVQIQNARAPFCTLKKKFPLPYYILSIMRLCKNGGKFGKHETGLSTVLDWTSETHVRQKVGGVLMYWLVLYLSRQLSIDSLYKYYSSHCTVRSTLAISLFYCWSDDLMRNFLTGLLSEFYHERINTLNCEDGS